MSAPFREGLSAHYARGSWVAIAGARTWILIDLDPAAREISALWALLYTGADHHDVLDVLTPIGMRGLPGFALLSLDGTAATVIVRGAGVARIMTADGTIELAASSMTTWREHTVTSPEEVHLLGGAEPGGAMLQLPAGVVPAASLRICTPGPVRIDAEPRAGMAHAEDPFGDAAFAVEGAQGPGDAQEPGDGKVRELIDRVPWLVASEPPPPPPPDAPAVVEQAATGVQVSDVLTSGLTITREMHGDLLAASASPAPLPHGAAMVQAVHCPDGHPCPPGTSICRVCSAVLGSQPASAIPQPVLGVLRMSTGDVITLDRGVLLGRSPSSGRLVGGERPHVVTLPSPDTSISRNHLEVLVDGWRVLVSDLNTTNGTIVTAPGAPPERLQPGASTEITPGTTVALSDRVSFRYETSV